MALQAVAAALLLASTTLGVPALSGLSLDPLVVLDPTQPASSPVDLTIAVAGPIAWEPSPVTEAYPYFSVYGHATAAQDGHLAVVSFDRAYSPMVSIALRRPDGSWQGPVELGQAFDDHAFPAVAITADGIVHVVHGGHARPGFPIWSVSTLAPYDLSAWTEPVALDETEGSSYNNLAVGPDGTLYLTYRQGTSSTGALVLRKMEPGQAWGPPLVVARNHSMAVYPYDLAVDAAGTIHLAYMWREDGHAPWSDPSYMQSQDGGASWQSAGGESIQIPARRTSAARAVVDDVAQNPGLRMARDADGRLHLLYARTSTPHSNYVRDLLFDPTVGWTPLGGFATSSFALGYNQKAGSLEVYTTALGDASQVIRFSLAAGTNAWTAEPLGTFPTDVQLVTTSPWNVARPEASPWTVGASLPSAASPALRVAKLG
jgi:hypothetical protein